MHARSNVSREVEDEVVVEMVMVGEHSDSVVEEAGNTNDKGAATGGTEAPAKKAKIMMTVQTVNTRLMIT